MSSGKDLSKMRTLVPTLPAAQDPDGPTVARPIGMDPRRARQIQKQREENRNWLLKDDPKSGPTDADFGIRDYGVNVLDKWRSQDKAESKLDSAKEGPDKQTSSVGLLFDEERRAAKHESDPERKLSAHQSAELDFRGLLGPDLGGAAAAPSARNGLTLKESLLGLPAGASRDFNPGGLGSAASSSKPNAIVVPSGLADPASAAPDFTRRSINPVVGQPLGGFGSASALSSPGMGRLPDSASRPTAGFGSANQGGVSGFSSLPSPAFRDTKRTSGADPVRRAF